MGNLQQSLPKSLLSEARDVLDKKWTYPCMRSFPPKEKTITSLFQVLFPTNKDVNEVFVKASILNQFYKTSILAISTLAEGIVNLNIDKDLNYGDVSVVNKIANVMPMHRCYSFASKYCAMHNPCAYPINDKLVRGYLAKVIAKGHLTRYIKYKGKQIQIDFKMQRNYSIYKDVYDAFMMQYGLTSLGYKDIDAYIWIACKEKKSNNFNLFELTK